jgi:hypothetical protein
VKEDLFSILRMFTGKKAFEGKEEKYLWALLGSNQRPADYESAALTN